MTRRPSPPTTPSVADGWSHVEWTVEDSARYRTLTGSSSSEPGGLAVAVARRALGQRMPLPQGGVLLGIEVEPGTWDVEAGTHCRIARSDREDSRGRTVADITVELRSPDAVGSAAIVTFAIRLPEEVTGRG